MDGDALEKEDGENQEEKILKKTIEVGRVVVHKTYGEGIISKITKEKRYVQFDNGSRIFPIGRAFEKAI